MCKCKAGDGCARPGRANAARGGGAASLGSQVGLAIRMLTDADVAARLDAAMEYGRTLPASNGKTAVTGFCKQDLSRRSPVMSLFLSWPWSR